MDLALLVLRAVVGLFFAGHGAQKLFGAFGGHGIAGTGQFFESLGMRPGALQARAAGTAELAGGVLLVLGLFTPFAAAMIISVMIVAIITVHGKNGPWVTESGYEYNAVLIAAAFALAGAGAGSISLDAAFGLDLAGTGWALAALGAGILGAVGAIAMGRRTGTEPTSAPAATPEPVAAPTGRFAREESGDRTTV
jgi:putative oxidoreductase